MSSTEENYKLLLFIISQITSYGKLIGIDWQLVGNDIGLERREAANPRWSRFQKAHGLAKSGNGAARTGALETGGKKQAARKVEKAGVGKIATKTNKVDDVQKEATSDDDGSKTVLGLDEDHGAAGSASEEKENIEEADAKDDADSYYNSDDEDV